MNSLLILVPISLVLLGIAIAAFVWAVRRGQFDDLETPPLDILRDDDKPARGRSHDTSATREEARAEDPDEP